MQHYSQEGRRTRMKSEDDLGVSGAGQSIPLEQDQSNTSDGSSQERVEDRELGYDDFPDFVQSTLDRIGRRYAEAEERWAQRVAEGRVYEDTLTPDDLRELARRIREGEDATLPPPPRTDEVVQPAICTSPTPPSPTAQTPPMPLGPPLPQK